MSSHSKLATIDQNSPNKVPVLLQGDLTPAVMRQYKNACLGFFEGKEIVLEKQVCKILAGLHDNRIQEWISIDCDEILTLTFAEFMVESKAGFLPEDWEEITCIKLLAMQQGVDSFLDFAMQVQSKNMLLCDTNSFLDKDQLRHHIESGMTPKLTLHCHHKKSNRSSFLKSGLQMSDALMTFFTLTALSLKLFRKVSETPLGAPMPLPDLPIMPMHPPPHLPPFMTNSPGSPKLNAICYSTIRDA
jgi:hypothetical protein